jgi:hypothetical protein
MTLLELKRLLEMGDRSKVVLNGFSSAKTTKKDWDALDLVATDEPITIGGMRDRVRDYIGSSFESCYGPPDQFYAEEDTVAYFEGAELDLTTVLDWIHA